MLDAPAPPVQRGNFVTIEKRDWTLLAIAAAQGEPLDPVQLQKSLFLLGEKRRGKVGAGFYKFRPYHYGPFCADIYSDADSLADAGLVEVSSGAVRGYSATAEGLEGAEGVADTAPEAGEYLTNVVRWARSLSFQELVRAVYAEFPEQRANSVFSG